MDFYVAFAYMTGMIVNPFKCVEIIKQNLKNEFTWRFSDIFYFREFYCRKSVEFTNTNVEISVTFCFNRHQYNIKGEKKIFAFDHVDVCIWEERKIGSLGKKSEYIFSFLPECPVDDEIFEKRSILPDAHI
jgi:hypothetical protein